jgi:hypothetical protein
MSLRAVLLSAVLLALAAPNASAAIADRFMPVYDRADGVTAGRQSAQTAFVRFGSKAARLYRDLAGAKAIVGCGDPTVKDDGSRSILGDSSGRTLYGAAGYLWAERSLPRQRGRVAVPTGAAADVCFIATKEQRSDDLCLSLEHDADTWCVRVIVALTDKGRAGLDARSRALELDLVFGVPLAEIQKEFGADAAVALAGPDASPPPGTVGVFQNGQTTIAVAVLADGRRLFVRQEGDVFSTNVPELSGRRGTFGLI